MMHKYLKSITFKALLAILLAFLATYFVSSFFSGLLSRLLLSSEQYDPIELVNTYNWIAFAMIASNIIVFVAIFVFFIKKRIKYLNYIIQSVSKIENEEFLSEIKVEGQDEFAELAMSINTMSRRLEDRFEHEKQVEQSKYELITSVSHDLKTPLTSLIGYLELLHKGEQNEEYIDIAYNKSLRLKDLVDELFEYTKLTSYEFKIIKDTFNFSSLLNQYVGESVLDFEQKKITVKLQNPFDEILINGDIHLISRVLENLIKNAQKYSDTDSIFQVVVESNDNNVTIHFTNQCKDLNLDDAEKLFEKFYRLDTSRSDYQEGSGLGLTISKHIAELHKGTLVVIKEEDLVTFVLTLPKQS